MSKPFIVEFLGTPEAGKTTTMNGLIHILQKKYTIEFVRESAEISPKGFKKGGIEAHLWMQNLTINKMLEAESGEADIVLVDRGMVDAYFWNRYYFHKGQKTEEQYKACNDYLHVMPIITNVAFFFFTTPEEAIKRRGGEGKVVTLSFIKEFNEELVALLDEYKGQKVCIDTTNLSQEEVVAILNDELDRILKNS